MRGQEWLSGKIDYTNGINDFFNILKKRWKKGFKIIYTPQTGREIADLSAISKMIYAAQGPTSPNITLFIDEAQDGVPSGIAQRDAANGVVAIARKGRDRGINLLIASQRVKTVDISIRANLSYVYYFKLRELADIKEANQLINDFESLVSMENFEYWLIDKSGNKKFFKKK